MYNRAIYQSSGSASGQHKEIRKIGRKGSKIGSKIGWSVNLNHFGSISSCKSHLRKVIWVDAYSMGNQNGRL